MTKLQLIEVNCETGEEILRDFTEEEQAQRDAEFADYVALQQKLESETVEAQAKRQTLLDKLGITEEEARLLLGGN